MHNYTTLYTAILHYTSKNLQEVTGSTSSPKWNLWKPLTYCSIEENSFSLKFELWYSFYIADQETARYSLYSAGENCVSWAEPWWTFKMYNRQFIQFASIPVEFVARLWDMSTQKYNNFSIAAVILKYLLLISP